MRLRPVKGIAVLTIFMLLAAAQCVAFCSAQVIVPAKATSPCPHHKNSPHSPTCPHATAKKSLDLALFSPVLHVESERQPSLQATSPVAGRCAHAPLPILLSTIVLRI